MLNKIEDLIEKYSDKLNIALIVITAFASGVLFAIGLVLNDSDTLMSAGLGLIISISYGVFSYYSVRAKLLDELMQNYGDKSKLNN